MFKKLISSLGITALLLLLMPTVSAAGTYVSGLDVKVGGTSVTTFNPTLGSAQVSFSLLQAAEVYAYVVDSSNPPATTVLQTRLAYTAPQTTVTYPFYGRLNNSATGNYLPSGSYTVKVEAYLPGGTTPIDFETKTITISTPAFSLTAYTVTPATFDPAPQATNQDLSLTYTLSQIADAVSIVIKDSNNTQVKSFSAVTDAEKTSASYMWDGLFGTKLIEPGAYTAALTATKAGYTTLTDTKTFTTVYAHANKPAIENLTVLPASFDPDVEDTVISFKNTKDCKITVEVLDASNGVLRAFSGYSFASFTAGQTHSIAWDGKNNAGNYFSVGSYKVKVRTENDYGVVVETKTVTVDNSGGSIPSSNAHIVDISFSPSTKFEPADDEELTIKFDVKVALDELKVSAIRGTTKIEIYNETSVEQQNRLEMTWDGTNTNDDYVDEGTWRILIESKVGTQTLQAAKSIEIDYDKPEIDDVYISKTKFDNDLDEFTYVLFRVDSEALVDIYVLEDGSEDENITEDLEVEKDKWYAVEWDGGSYDYTDNLDIKVIAKNKANENVYDMEKVDVDLAEDTASSSKSNVTNDYISPVATSGFETMTLYYNLEEEADVTVTIHKGRSLSGTIEIELLDITNQEAGTHELQWDGKNKKGSRLAKGFYTYKIVSKKSSTETESGIFVVGTVGNVEGTASGSGGSSADEDNTTGGTISSHVIVDGGGIVEEEEPPIIEESDCGGFSDVPVSSPYCEAAGWAYSKGIFEGYSDGTFKPNQTINRVEFLKVLLESSGTEVQSTYADYSNLGFTDVDPYAWYMPYIRTARSLGIFQGDAGKSTARPADTVNRAEALKMTFETLRVLGKYNTSACVQPYPDVPAGAWYYNYACAADKYNLFDGVMLNPAKLSTRGEIAEMLYRLYGAGIF